MVPHTSAQPPAIADYAFLSDCSSAALISREASIDWWCVPRFDSPSVFGRLLDPEAGHWTLNPREPFSCTRSYLEDTLVLCTRLQTERGSVLVTDALAFEPESRGHDIGRRSPHVLLRTIEGLEGSVPMQTEFAPRMEYGRTQPQLRVTPAGVEALGGPVRLDCVGAIPWSCADGGAVADFDVAAGQRVQLRLQYTRSFGSTSAGDITPATVADTVAGWRSWVQLHSGYDGAFPAEVRRSSIVLQGLTYQPSGAVVAAATTSLPELVGGDLNFDYRFAWLRDLSLTIRSLWIAACPDEPNRLFSWFSIAAGRTGAELVQIMYGVEGERDLTERELGNLTGYRDSRPVRVGNQAWQQKQLDVLGEVLDAADTLSDVLGELDEPSQHLLVSFANRAAASWSEPDAGMWEARDAERHYTSSKVMCWVALDRAVTLAPRLGPTADAPRWATVREEIRAAVLDQAWSGTAGAYTGAFGSDELDASVLILPLVGFLPASDQRMWASIEAIEKHLSTDGLVRRWSAEPNGFLICMYWLVECLALGGQPERAELAFRRATACANDLGLLAEQVDPKTGDLLGNMPQAFSHVGLINAAWRLAHPTSATTARPSNSETP